MSYVELYESVVMAYFLKLNKFILFLAIFTSYWVSAESLPTCQGRLLAKARKPVAGKIYDLFLIASNMSNEGIGGYFTRFPELSQKTKGGGTRITDELLRNIFLYLSHDELKLVEARIYLFEIFMKLNESDEGRQELELKIPKLQKKERIFGYKFDPSLLRDAIAEMTANEMKDFLYPKQKK
jgi:hypothetical protein